MLIVRFDIFIVRHYFLNILSKICYSQAKCGKHAGPTLTLQCGDRLYKSESDVCRRQMPTYKDGPTLKEF